MTALLPEPTADSTVDELLEDVARTKAELHAGARAKLGVGATEAAHGRSLLSFLTVCREHNTSLYPLIALALLSVVDTFQGFAFTVLTPDITRTLGLSLGAIAGARALQGLATATAPLPMAALSQSKARRALLCIVTGLGWSIMTLYTGLVPSLGGLILVLCLDGLTTGSVAALHQPLVMDYYHPTSRVRAMSYYGAAVQVASLLSPLLVGVLAGPLDLTWRGVFLVLGGVSLLTTLGALGLRDPGFGKWDTQQLRDSVHELHGETNDLSADDVALGFWEICRRLLLIPTIRRLLAGFMVLGLLTIPLATFLSFFLDEQWGLGPSQRAVFFAGTGAVGALSLVLYGNRAERAFRRSPAALVRRVGQLLALAIVLIAVAGLSPVFWGMALAFAASSACLAVLGPGLAVSLLSIIPSRMRPHAASVVGIFVAAGGMVGSLFLTGIDTRFGIVGTMVAVTVPGVAGALIIGSASRFIEADLDHMIDEVLEDEELNRLTRSGAKMPMLACRGIDFSYGQLQVLFDVDFTVDQGEMVALLGVNGAGKSTLLKVISGIGLPTAGSVRFRGQDITYLDAERRLRLGITQIPGGRSVFGSMTVLENLRGFGYVLGRDRKRVEQLIDDCFAAFPRLAERRESLAATLSGGEQQMLGLTKALILKPSLLVIDELSLGLAPIIVGQLLDMVRRINAEGTAVVLVEQSVNIALELVEHAYFMEKGQMRFDGAANDLLAREDLLRAVFLHGAQAQAST